MASAQQGPSLALLADIPDQDLEDIFAAIRRGAETPADAMGFGPEALNAIEQMALGYYKARVWHKAAVIFGFLLRMSPKRASAWRGLGACAQSLKDYERAARCYEYAVEHDPNDVVAKVFWGEALCQVGDKERGLALLEKVIADGTSEPTYMPYLTRARAVVGAGGGVPPKIVLMREGKRVMQEAGEALLEAGVDLDPDREITPEDILKNPALNAQIQELGKAIDEGRLSFAQLGGFTDKELEGAYVVACKYLEMGQLAEAMQIAGYLIFLNPSDTRFFQLVGICMHRLKIYDAAEHFYKLALAIEPNDPPSWVFRGEAKIMAGEIDQGLVHIQKGLEQAGTATAHRDIVDRAKILLRQFGRASGG